MNLYNQIYLRKSCRKYTMTPLPAKQLAEIEAFIHGMRPLFPEVQITHRMAERVQIKGMLMPKAPHYLIISGAPAPYRELCAGFLFQQLDLYLSAQGLGTCWLGVAKGREKSEAKDDILSLCFGEAAEPQTRTVAEFKRKALAEIASGDDPRLEAARLAPSGLNAQPWYFIAQEGDIHVYQAVPRKLRALLYDLEELDVGIALCHLMLATEAQGGAFQFETDGQNPPMAPQGFAYTGTVKKS